MVRHTHNFSVCLCDVIGKELLFVMSLKKRKMPEAREGKGRQQDKSTQEIAYCSCASVKMREQILGQLAKLKGEEDKGHVTSHHPRESASNQLCSYQL
jgi:hypothetical protein